MELLPTEVARTLPDFDRDPEGEPYAFVKFFTPDSSWTWYASEFDGDDLFYGLVDGVELEYGYFRLSELEETRGPWGLPIERDLWFTPRPMAELYEELSERRREYA